MSQDRVFSFEFLHQSLKQLLLFLKKHFMLKELLLSLIDLNSDNSDPKNPPDWIILEIWALESLMSVNILLISAFLSFVFLPCCQEIFMRQIISIKHFQTHSQSCSCFIFDSSIQFFSVVSLIILHLLYCIRPSILITEVLLFLCKILTVSFDVWE